MPRKKRSLKDCEVTDTDTLSEDALLDDAIFHLIPCAKDAFPSSFQGPIVRAVTRDIIRNFVEVDSKSSPPKKKKLMKASEEEDEEKDYRGTSTSGDPRYDYGDFRALVANVKSNLIMWLYARHSTPPITTGHSTLSPDIALTADNLLKTWTLWQLFQSHKQGEINRELLIGAGIVGQSDDVRHVLSVRVCVWVRSTFKKSFSRKSQDSESKRYLIFADENNTKYPRSILLVQNNWVLQMECEANCENGTIPEMFGKLQQLGICFGCEFTSKTDVCLYLYGGNNANVASTQQVLERCRFKLFYRLDSKPKDEMMIVIKVKDTKKPEFGENYSFTDEVLLPVAMPSVDSSASAVSSLPSVPSIESPRSSASTDYGAVAYNVLVDKYNAVINLYNALVPMQMRMSEMPMVAQLSAMDTPPSTGLSAEYGPAVLDESMDPFMAAIYRGTKE